MSESQLDPAEDTEATAGSARYALCAYDEIPNRTAKAISIQGVNAKGEVESCPLVLVRWDDDVFGYINICPHQAVQLDAGVPGQFFNPERSHLLCERHGAMFEVDTGLCLDGPCEGKGLTPLSLEIVDGSVCLANVRTVEVDETAAE